MGVHSSFYSRVFDNWQKQWGSKPTETQLSIAHQFAKRGNGKQALCLAMALADKPRVANHMWLAAALLDNSAKPTTHRNFMLHPVLGVVAGGYFVRDMSAPAGCIKLTLTPKGEQHIIERGAVQNDKLKAKAKALAPAKPAKVRKPKAAPVTVEHDVTAPPGDVQAFIQAANEAGA